MRVWLLILLLLSACHTHRTDPPPAPVAVTPLVAASVDTRFVTMDHMIASFEMQLSGEPLAEAMGRQLAGYSRNYLPANMYFDPTPNVNPWLDLAGFSTAVESYEYSKQPMNNLSFESGAGVSLAFGPVVNPSGWINDQALPPLLAQVQHLAAASNVGTIITFDPAPVGNPRNLLGWPGLWPILHPYRSFDPSIQPSTDTRWRCTIASDDNPGAMGVILNQDYECDYNTLHLLNRDQQIERVITPGASGWTDWKQALWTVNYLQILHDEDGTAVASVAPGDAATVGTPLNMIMGVPAAPGTNLKPGVYLGSSNIEGFQAGLMITELDNQAEHWLSALTTTDGATLSGFPSGATCPATNTSGCDSAVMAALQYDYTSALRWIPSQIAVKEAQDTSGFPRPYKYSIQSSDSSLIDLLGLLGAYSEAYALTDRGNVNVGGTQTAEVYFDGDPFPQDDQSADGEATLHDRALALMRFVVVTLDRIHRDPTTGLLADNVTMTNGAPVSGGTIDAASAAYVLVALRNVRRSLDSQLALYSNTTPDIAVVHTPLDDVPFNGAPEGGSFTERLTALINAHAALFFDHLTTPDGHALSGWDFVHGMPTDTADMLDAHTAAIRGLLQAYLSTGNTKYRDRALAVFARMDRDFYDPAARVYNTSPGSVTSVTYTPRRFAMLEGALRDLYELWGCQPGHQQMGTHLEALIARHIKLILNGWDDRNGDGTVQWPDECVQVVGGLPRGGLQMAERALSGETGAVNDTINDEAVRVYASDREHDCVPEISTAQLPAALASQLTLQAMRR